jgi:hypothetical protein
MKRTSPPALFLPPFFPFAGVAAFSSSFSFSPSTFFPSKPLKS